MNTQVQSSLSTVDQRLNGLLSSLTLSPNAVGAPAAAISLLEADDALTASLSTLRQHQQNYSKILRLRAEAAKLDERVKGIVRDIEVYEKEARVVCDDDDVDESDSESESESDSDYETELEEGGGDRRQRETIDNQQERKRKSKEIDYRLLLDFARRISKYNHQAAADGAVAGIDALESSKKNKVAGQPQEDVVMNGTASTGPGPTATTTPGPETESVSAVTKNATMWLDESAKQTRQFYMLPYPTEDRIRMGLMGKIQFLASEGRPDFDPDREVERLVREAESFGVASEAPNLPHPMPSETEAAPAAPTAPTAPEPAAHPRPAATGGDSGETAPPAQQPSLILDLYDPEDDV